MANLVKARKTPNLEAVFSVELVGQAIRARRSQSHLRLEDAASLCKVSKQTFMKVEHGAATAQFSSVLKILNGLGIKLQIVSWEDKGGDDDSQRS